MFSVGVRIQRVAGEADRGRDREGFKAAWGRLGETARGGER